VRGLPAVAFHLFERGAEQHILSVGEAEVPVSVIIVFDESGSMGRGVTQCAQAVKQFLKGSTEGDEFALISFSDRVVLESDFTADAGAIQARLMGAASHGRTALLDAVERAASLVRRAHNQRRVILVLSDGGDNRSRYRETEVRRLLLETPAQVYAVSIAQFFQDDSTAFGPDLLDRLCYVSGGRNVAIDGHADLDRDMTRVNDEIRAEYILAYSPQHVVRDGSFTAFLCASRAPAGSNRFPCPGDSAATTHYSEDSSLVNSQDDVHRGVPRGDPLSSRRPVAIRPATSKCRGRPQGDRFSSR
jgi:Ca-activated chloride channel homolog